MELFVFVENLVLESVLYKGNSNIPLLFEILLYLHQVQMKGELILHVVHIVGTRMIDPGIDGLSRGNNLGGIMRGLEPLKFLPLNIRYPGALVTILMGRHFDYPGCHGMV